MSAELSGSLAGNYGFADVIIWLPRPVTPSILIFASPHFPACLSNTFKLFLWKAKLRGVLWTTRCRFCLSIEHNGWLQITVHYYCVGMHKFGYEVLNLVLNFFN